MTSDNLKALIGTKSRPTVFQVTRTDIRRIADAVENRNPLYWDDEYAARSKYGAIIAPPDFFGWPVKWGPNTPFLTGVDFDVNLFMEVAKAGYMRAINAGMETDFFLPIRAGDTLVISGEIVNIEEKEGKKGGKMCISTLENTVKNQNGDVVAKQRIMTIH